MQEAQRLIELRERVQVVAHLWKGGRGDPSHGERSEGGQPVATHEGAREQPSRTSKPNATRKTTKRTARGHVLPPKEIQRAIDDAHRSLAWLWLIESLALATED